MQTDSSTSYNPVGKFYLLISILDQVVKFRVPPVYGQYPFSDGHIKVSSVKVRIYLSDQSFGARKFDVFPFCDLIYMSCFADKINPCPTHPTNSPGLHNHRLQNAHLVQLT